MKQLLLLISLTFIAATTLGQDCYDIELYLQFDDTFEPSCVYIDTLSNPNNIWQIGTPQKANFTSAYSSPNAIVTDLVDPYPTNDTSVFIIQLIASGVGFGVYNSAILAGEYFVNSDSLTDYGKIEFSPDNGITWTDLLNDTILMDSINNFYWSWGDPRPILTGNSNGWQYFATNLATYGNFFDVHYGDTILYRFTFISDSIQSDKDGLMFDNFYFWDFGEGIESPQNNNLISIYPNPSSDKLVVLQKSQPADKSAIQILNCSGQVIYSDQHFTGAPVDTKLLSNGIYFLKYSDSKSFAIKKFVVNH